MYIIIVGAGEIGLRLLEIAMMDKNDVVVVEENEERVREVSTKYDCVFINADATLHDNLKEAGAKDADALISTTSDDSVNMMVMLNGNDIGIPSLVSVVNHPSHIKLFRRLGANVIENPQKLIAEYLYRAVRKPSIKNFMELTKGAEVFEITVSEGSSVVGKTIKEADEKGLIPSETIIVAIDRNGNLITPKGNTEIQSGDLVTLFSQKGATQNLVKVFTAEAK